MLAQAVPAWLQIIPPGLSAVFIKLKYFSPNKHSAGPVKSCGYYYLSRVPMITIPTNGITAISDNDVEFFFVLFHKFKSIADVQCDLRMYQADTHEW